VLSGISDKQAGQLALDPRIEHVEADRYATLFQYQSSPRWGLDRIDQRNLPYNYGYSYPNTGAGINVYVIDSGVYPNSDFGGRVNSAGGYTAVNDGYGTSDCNGHGTHVAGIVGSYTYGVAKSVNIYPVRIFGCDTNAPISQIISGVNWVTGHRVKPAIANMSLGYTGSSTSLDQATQSLINSGVIVVAAAGNDSGDACNVSPARVAGVITVGGTTDADTMYSLSNYGTCVDIYAPATGVKSTYNTGAMSTMILDGTSMASPHVAGVAANYLVSHPTASPSAVSTYLREAATTRKIVNSAAGTYCANANALLFNGPPSPVGAPGTPTNLLAERTCNGHYLMTWNSGSGPSEDSYEVYQTVSSKPGCEGYLISTTGRSIGVGTPSGQNSKYRVRACNSVGCSGYSLPTSATSYSGCQ
jgi:serine protease